MQLDREKICERIPHAGSMCLLEKMISWDADHIKCSTKSHGAQDNPLKVNDKLTSIAAIEYAGQAMALHGGLVSEATTPGKSPRKGYLASLREISVSRDTINDIDGELVIEADLMMGDQDSSLYSFTVSSEGRPVISGRAAVKLLEEMDS